MDIKDIKKEIKEQMDLIVDEINKNKKVEIKYKRLTITKGSFHISFWLNHNSFHSNGQVHMFFKSKDGKNIEIDYYYIQGANDKSYEFTDKKDDTNLFIEQQTFTSTTLSEECNAKTIKDFFDFIIDFCESNHVQNLVQPWVLSLDEIYNKEKKEHILNAIKNYYNNLNIKFDLNKILYEDISKVIENSGYLINNNSIKEIV